MTTRNQTLQTLVLGFIEEGEQSIRDSFFTGSGFDSEFDEETCKKYVDEFHSYADHLGADGKNSYNTPEVTASLIDLLLHSDEAFRSKVSKLIADKLHELRDEAELGL